MVAFCLATPSRASAKPRSIPSSFCPSLRQQTIPLCQTNVCEPSAFTGHWEEVMSLLDPVLEHALAKCPFLHSVKHREGHEFAKRIAVNPFIPAAGPPVKRPLLEELDDYGKTFAAFHGASGPVPLVMQHDENRNMQGCPLQQQAALQTTEAKVTCPYKSAPFASMSLSFGNGMPDFGRILRAIQQHQEQVRKVTQPAKRSLNSGDVKPEVRKPNASTPSSASHSKITTSNPGNSVSHNSNAGASGGTCPLRKMLGPLAPIVFNPKGHLQCPEPIIRARAALAATKPVRGLRPQALPVKLAAVGAVTAALNVPCGMVREHTEKFSFGWFVAVHASIPFIAMLRKAVIMPKYAILFTIATAIAGQAMGAKMERKRLSRIQAIEAASPEAKTARYASSAGPASCLAQLGPQRVYTKPRALRFTISHKNRSSALKRTFTSRRLLTSSYEDANSSQQLVLLPKHIMGDCGSAFDKHVDVQVGRPSFIAIHGSKPVSVGA